MWGSVPIFCKESPLFLTDEEGTRELPIGDLAGCLEGVRQVLGSSPFLRIVLRDPDLARSRPFDSLWCPGLVDPGPYGHDYSEVARAVRA